MQVVSSDSMPPGIPARLPQGRLCVYAIVILALAEFIGSVTFRIGRGHIVLSPLIWALVMGAVAGGLQAKMGSLALTQPLQIRAAEILQPALLLFVAKTGLMVGGLLPGIADVGGMLVFQQIGHAVGTVVIGLPLAMLLGLKREAIGATFSAGRETSLAIIGERYGMNSPEGRGVLAEYLTGALIGAVFIGVFASFVASLHIFHPVALAMGAGIGSGGMMAAAAGAIAAQQTPQMAEEVIRFAAAGNLLNTIVGTYCMLFISLPLATWGYRVLEPVIGWRTSSPVPHAVSFTAGDEDSRAVKSGFTGRIGAWIFSGGLTIAANWIGYRVAPVESAVCIAVLIVVVCIGDVLSSFSGKRISAVFWVTAVAMLLTSPVCPWARDIAEAAGKIGMPALTTPLLTLAGLSLAKDVPRFGKLGWRIVLTSLAAYVGTFLCATVIAEIFY